MREPRSAARIIESSWPANVQPGGNNTPVIRFEAVAALNAACANLEVVDGK